MIKIVNIFIPLLFLLHFSKPCQDINISNKVKICVSKKFIDFSTLVPVDRYEKDNIETYLHYAFSDTSIVFTMKYYKWLIEDSLLTEKKEQRIDKQYSEHEKSIVNYNELIIDENKGFVFEIETPFEGTVLKQISYLSIINNQFLTIEFWFHPYKKDSYQPESAMEIIKSISVNN
jgi:hypothetical protein